LGWGCLGIGFFLLFVKEYLSNIDYLSLKGKSRKNASSRGKIKG